MKKVAVITGANSGIGLETCRQLLAEDWTVFALDIGSANLDAMPDSLRERLSIYRCDVASAPDVSEVFKSISNLTTRIDALICSAGILRTSPLMEMSVADFDNVFAVNTRGPWLCARAAMPLLRERSAVTSDGPARVIMLASIAVVRPKVGGGAYAASKAALNHLVRVMSVELGGQNIRVNAVAPATVDTPMIRAVAGDGHSGYKPSGNSPIGTVATPEDIVPVIKFLLTPASNYINGTMLTVDGGTSAAFVPGTRT